MRRLANILLGIWLVLRGLITLTDFNFQGSATILAIMAIVAGALLLLSEWGEKFSAHVADFVLGLWLILAGLVPLFNVNFRGSHAVLEVLALLAGVLVIIRRK